jgi:hypothetical protein
MSDSFLKKNAESFTRDANNRLARRVILGQELAYNLKLDDTGTYTYVGQAVPTSGTDEAVWQIRRVTNATGDLVHADGDGNFDNVWDDRASLDYS